MDKTFHSEDIYSLAANKINFLLNENKSKDISKIQEKQRILRNKFQKEYSPQKLKHYNGMDLWNVIWNHGKGDTKEPMIYALRNGADYEQFGSARSQDVASLPMHYRKKDKSYVVGRDTRIVGLKDCLVYAESFRDRFVDCVLKVEKTKLESIEDFINLGEFINNKLDGKGEQMWVHKYLHMFFPDKFSQFHSEEFKINVLCSLGIVPEKSFYGMAGQLYILKEISELEDFCEFATIIYESFHSPEIGRNKVYVLNINNTYYEMVNNWESESIATIDINMFAEQNVKETLEENEALFVLQNNEELLGILYNVSSKKTKNIIYSGLWHRCFYKNDRLNSRLSSRSKKIKLIDDANDLILVFDRYYNKYYYFSNIEAFIENKIEEYKNDYYNKFEKRIIDFLNEYPVRFSELQKKLDIKGIEDFGNRLDSLGDYFLEDINLKSSLDNSSKTNIARCIAMTIINKEPIEGAELSLHTVAAILSLYNSEKCFCITDPDIIDLVLDEIKIPNEIGNIWDKQKLIRKWIQSRIGKKINDPLLQNYIFVRGVKEWLGVDTKLLTSNKEIKLSSVDSDIRDEYETVEYTENKQIQEGQEGVITEVVDYVPVPEIKEFAEITDSTGKLLPKRDAKRKVNAMILSNFRCEFDPNHKTFISRSTGKPYVEAHHLIPMEFYDDFEYSLDVEANIVCLCSNCHNEIHYGIHNAEIVRKLYETRKEQLYAAGLEISEEELLSKAYSNTGKE